MSQIKAAKSLLPAAVFAIILFWPGTTLAVDTDGDGIDDTVDNCPAVFNPGQSDLDVDGAFAVRAMTAGCDLLLYCHDLGRAERAIDAMVVRSREDAAFRGRLRSAADATAALARRFPLPTPDLDAWREARDRLAGFEA